VAQFSNEIWLSFRLTQTKRVLSNKLEQDDFEIHLITARLKRDIRMMKVQQQISDIFRSVNGAKTFCRIRGYISTARKNSLSVIDAIQNAFEGNPCTVSTES